MIEKIIDFVALPFVFVTDFIERCRCKHSWKLVYSESDGNRVYQLFVCRKCGSQKTKTYKHNDKHIIKLRYCALVDDIYEFYLNHPGCYKHTYPFKLSDINTDGSLTGPFYAIRGFDEDMNIIVDCPVPGYPPEITEEYKIPQIVFRNCFVII